jgi:two-component system sensor histidine kinase KdpD
VPQERDDRPAPESFLALAQAEEEKTRGGQLKVFFGAAPGVGKTFSMLQKAHELKTRGVDVVVGWVETHGRRETEALLEGLEILPSKMIEYRGTTLREFDLDAALARRPAVLLVDELAHTNAPGSRHAKRWQDVEELLDAQITVYTTLNVQHVESLNDVVAQITGIEVRETVPDAIFERADTVELVDLSADELLQRLREGKVYVAEQAQRAIERFFREGNLIALRELALRRTAERVDEQMQGYRQMHRVGGIWPVTERLLVGIGGGAESGRLIRAARRMAARLRAQWLVVHVATPATLKLPEAEKERIWEHLQLAEQLGAETAVLSGLDVSDELLRYARARNVSKIVLGKPARPRWRHVLSRSVRDRLIDRSGDVDIYVLSGEGAAEPSKPKAPRLERHSPLRSYLWAVAVTAVCGALSAAMFPVFEKTNQVMVFLLGVVFVAVRFGRGPSILASVLSVAVFAFFFVEPYLTFAVSDTQYLVTFAVMLVTALVISTLAVRLRERAEVARQRERRTAVLYALSRDLAAARDTEAILRSGVAHVFEVFYSQVMILLPDRDGHVTERASATVTYLFDERERAVAQWVFDHGRSAGRYTDTLPESKGIYLPLRTAHGTLGVLGLHPAAPERLLDPEQLHLLETFANQLTLALERAELPAESAGSGGAPARAD